MIYLNNKVFQSHENRKKSLMLKEDEIWISKLKIDNSFTFEKSVTSNERFKEAKAVKFKNIQWYKFHPSDLILTINHQNILQKSSKETFVFRNEDDANTVNGFIQNKLNFSKSLSSEKLIRPIIRFGVPSLILSVLIIILNTMGPFENVESNSIGNGKRNFILFLINTIGITGLTIIILLPLLFLLYKLFVRLKNPTSEIIYQREILDKNR